MTLSNVIGCKLERSLRASIPAIEKTLSIISFMHIRYFVPSSNGPGPIAPLLPKHGWKQYNTTGNVHLQPFNWVRRSGCSVSQAKVKYTGQILFILKLAPAHLFSCHKKRKKEETERSHATLRHRSWHGRLSVSSNVNAERMSNYALRNKKWHFLKNGNSYWNEAIWSMKTW